MPHYTSPTFSKTTYFYGTFNNLTHTNKPVFFLWRCGPTRAMASSTNSQSRLWILGPKSEKERPVPIALMITTPRRLAMELNHSGLKREEGITANKTFGTGTPKIIETEKNHGVSGCLKDEHNHTTTSQGIRIIPSNTSFIVKIHLYTRLHVSAARNHHQASTVEQIQI
jgi:hypothetical protein